MMRFTLIIFLIGLIAFSCVKPNSTNPIPVIEYKGLTNLGKAYSGSQPPRDTAVMIIGYQDGDGDLFADNSSQGPTFAFIPFYFNTTTKKFAVQIDPITLDTQRITNTIRQPDNGYYKGKSIKGDIYIPMSQYRPNDSAKVIKFTGFMIDTKGHRSNVVSSPVYTLDF
jgi:hypothetical protein